jgi:predicted permease
VSIEQARAEMRVLDRSSIEALARGDPQWRRAVIQVTSARTGLSTPLHQQFGGPLLLLMTLVGGVLLVACVNIGGLLLARGAARQHEMAVRVALGASRFRIVRQVLTESLLLAAVGGLLGVAGARVGATMLMRIMIAGTRSPGQPPRLDIPLDARVLMFTIAISALAALLFGFVPAIAAFGSAPALTLRQTSATPARSRRIFGNGLVVAQVAICLALMSVSQLTVAHLRELRDHSLGFDRNDVLLMSVNTSRAKNRDQLAAVYRTLIPRLQTIPGVRAVATSAITPSAQGAASRFLRAEGFDEPAQDKSRAALNWVSPNYFATFRTPLLAGREFRDGDMDQPRRVIINETLARRYFASRDPIGLHLWLENERDPYEIVGVAGDAKYGDDIRLVPPPTVYVFAPMSSGSTTLSLRTDDNPILIAANARRIASDLLGPDAVQRTTTLADQVDAALVPERLMAILAAFFGAVGALLAAIGLYGLLAYTVARRTREIGIRMALGATRGDIMRMIVRGALALVVAGMFVGAPLAFWSTRIAAAVIENASPRRVPVTAAGAAMVAVAALAAWLPTRRATRVEPVTALRSE